MEMIFQLCQSIFSLNKPFSLDYANRQFARRHVDLDHIAEIENLHTYLGLPKNSEPF